ncbi:ArsR/SmtB family transcription factor [Burkholderia multivorans]|uniref:ArsR/SmtB family transcription factor n=1 Tax=Burkholderia multivorans TaxID=87883 RepID=UPI000CFF3E4E|nr:ArsR family transcriptional regulator [Burkholderia multivorans]MBU9403548.1 ArsR family transcriptional regulator [Burkholderia multivorans]MCO8609708.1 ArsR family transcriptional regulator [Burkholderia multivorans]MCO8638333.1 ArsR family transcriptional regulator [Burkholderia multivorans]MCO8644557.1 ArsR family transcriptional regulator [Burkholderia multivorans]PRH16838.1 transcriptional regulator [Burkholderia multivorans]
MSKRPLQKWSEQEEADLRRVWTADGPIKQYLGLFNGRSMHAVLAHGADMGLGERPNRNARAGHPTESAILRVLKLGPMDSLELSAKTGISRRTVMKHLKALHAKRRVYVSGWERFGASGYPARIYALGNRKDAQRPPARTPGQKWQDRMSHLKKHRPDEYMRVMARRRANAQRRTGTTKRDIAAQALFGRATA